VRLERLGQQALLVNLLLDQLVQLALLPQFKDQLVLLVPQDQREQQDLLLLFKDQQEQQDLLLLFKDQRAPRGRLGLLVLHLQFKDQLARLDQLVLQVQEQLDQQALPSTN
jgi:hypothetical protein